MTLHPCYVRHKPQRVRFQPQNIDIYEQMPDIEKIKINLITATAACFAIAGLIFVAGGWYFGTQQMQRDITDIKQLLIQMSDHDKKSDDRILVLEQRLDNIENYDRVRIQRGIQQ